MSNAILIREATFADLGAILATQEVCCEAPRWSPSTWERLMEKSEAGLQERSCFVAVIAVEIVGFIVASRLADISEIESVAVRNDVRRQGIGRLLCEHALEWARNLGSSNVELEVRATSVGALKLYDSLGFIEQGIRSGYYRDPKDDAVLLALSLDPLRR